VGRSMNPAQPNQPDECLRQINRWRMAFFAVVILAAGMIIGASAFFLLTSRLRPERPGPEMAAELLLRRQQRLLRLRPEQSERLQPILTEYIKKLHDIRINARKQIAEQLKLMNQQVLEILDERQKQLWQAQLRQLQSRFGSGPPWFGPGPHRRGPGADTDRPFGHRRLRPGGPPPQCRQGLEPQAPPPEPHQRGPEPSQPREDQRQ